MSDFNVSVLIGGVLYIVAFTVGALVWRSIARIRRGKR